MMQPWINFHITMERKIEKLDDRLESMRVRAGRIQEQKRARENQQLALLNRQRDTIRQDMLELKESEGTGWETLRANIEHAVEELEEGIDELFERLSESEQEER